MKFYDTIVYRIHAVRRMFERNISEVAIQTILKDGKVIQEYPKDQPYPSYLVIGVYEDRPIHLVVASNDDDNTTILITAYIPDPKEWKPGFTERKT